MYHQFCGLGKLVCLGNYKLFLFSLYLTDVKKYRGDESALENVLSLVEALLQLSEQQDCESKLPLCVVWDADKLRITGYKSEQTTRNRTKTTEVGTKKEYLLKQIKDASKTLKPSPAERRI